MITQFQRTLASVLFISHTLMSCSRNPILDQEIHTKAPSAARNNPYLSHTSSTTNSNTGELERQQEEYSRAVTITTPAGKRIIVHFTNKQEHWQAMVTPEPNPNNDNTQEFPLILAPGYTLEKLLSTPAPLLQNIVHIHIAPDKSAEENYIADYIYLGPSPIEESMAEPIVASTTEPTIEKETGLVLLDLPYEMQLDNARSPKKPYSTPFLHTSGAICTDNSTTKPTNFSYDLIEIENQSGKRLNPKEEHNNKKRPSLSTPPISMGSKEKDKLKNEMVKISTTPAVSPRPIPASVHTHRSTLLLPSQQTLVAAQQQARHKRITDTKRHTMPLHPYPAANTLEPIPNKKRYELARIQPVYKPANKAESMSEPTSFTATTPKGHQVNFVQTGDYWRAIVRENCPLGFARTLDLPVLYPRGTHNAPRTVARYAIENLARQQQGLQNQRVHVVLPSQAQKTGYVYTGPLMGLPGGGFWNKVGKVAAGIALTVAGVAAGSVTAAVVGIIALIAGLVELILRCRKAFEGLGMRDLQILSDRTRSIYNVAIKVVINILEAIDKESKPNRGPSNSSSFNKSSSSSSSDSTPLDTKPDKIGDSTPYTTAKDEVNRIIKKIEDDFNPNSGNSEPKPYQEPNRSSTLEKIDAQIKNVENAIEEVKTNQKNFEEKLKGIDINLALEKGKINSTDIENIAKARSEFSNLIRTGQDTLDEIEKLKKEAKEKWRDQAMKDLEKERKKAKKLWNETFQELKTTISNLTATDASTETEKKLSSLKTQIKNNIVMYERWKAKSVFEIPLFQKEQNMLDGYIKAENEKSKELAPIQKILDYAKNNLFIIKEIADRVQEAKQKGAISKELGLDLIDEPTEILEYTINYLNLPLFIKDKKNNTFLHLAAKCNQREKVEILLKHYPAAKGTRNTSGKLPVDLTKDLAIKALLNK